MRQLLQGKVWDPLEYEEAEKDSKSEFLGQIMKVGPNRD